MKLLDKLKNALFEEEYVEVEEKPKRKEIIREKKVKEPKRKEKLVKESKKEEEQPIAKKIIQHDKKEKEIEDEEVELTEDEHIGESLAYNPETENEFKFPMVSDTEFTSDSYYKEPPMEEKKTQKSEIPLYKENSKHENKPYGLDEFDLVDHDYGAYSKKEEKSYFKPSPIISPIYGILDKNYTKEDIVPKKEIRLTSTYAREKIDVDDVRKKAFGSLEDDIENEIENIDDYEEDNQLLDLSSDSKTPEVKRVTMGDAEEYFEDLGLEYNVDYKDTSKERASGRRIKENYEQDTEESMDLEETEEDNEVTEKDLTQKEVKIVDNSDIDADDINDTNDNDDDNDDNLFDLIDSMYDKD